VLSLLDLESFEALGIKAKLRSTLGEAEDRLRQIDSTIAVLSKMALLQAMRGLLLTTNAKTL